MNDSEPSAERITESAEGSAPELRDMVRRIHDRVRAAAVRSERDPDSIRLIAATKKRTSSEIRTVVSTGLIDGCGENRVQEAIPKIAALECLGIEWHYFGRLQTNKVGKLDAGFTWLHSFDRFELIDHIARRAPSLRLLVEVNVSGEQSKAGIAPDRAPALVRACLDAGLDVSGLMTMAPYGDAVAASAVFGDLRLLRDRLQDELGVGLEHLSMGMTDDFESAIGHGATMLRIGRGIFGPRPPARTGVFE